MSRITLEDINDKPYDGAIRSNPNLLTDSNEDLTAEIQEEKTKQSSGEGGDINSTAVANTTEVVNSGEVNTKSYTESKQSNCCLLS